MSINYTPLVRDLRDMGIEGLKTELCDACRADGNIYRGECKQCLANTAHNREWLQTHTFIYDDKMRGYHNDGHDNIKGLRLRLPDEKPLLYYGIENEITFGSDTHVGDEDEEECCEDEEGEDISVSEINEILEEFSYITDGLFVYERDSTVRNGVEIISRPASYRYWTHPDTQEKLRKGYEFLRERGALLDQPGGNGLHIHISRAFFRSQKFSETETAAYSAYDWIYQQFQDEMERIGSRRYTDYCASKKDVAKRYITNPSSVPYASKVKLSCEIKKDKFRNLETNHAHAVIITSDTIETRIFRSTTDVDTMMAYLEVVRNCAHFARETDDKKSLREILHTKENIYLDKYLQQVSMKARKDNATFDLDKLNEDIIKVEA